MPPKAQPRHTLSYQLREIVESRGLTAYALGQLAKVDPGVVSRFLNGQRDIRLETADRLALALGVRLTELARPAPARKVARPCRPSRPALVIPEGPAEPAGPSGADRFGESSLRPATESEALPAAVQSPGPELKAVEDAGPDHPEVDGAVIDDRAGEAEEDGAARASRRIVALVADWPLDWRRRWGCLGSTLLGEGLAWPQNEVEAFERASAEKEAGERAESSEDYSAV